MQREKEIVRVTLWGSAANVALVVFKFVAGIMGNSAAMVADAVHSLSDFLTDIIVLVFVRISAKPQDESHDYGHGKYETIASFIIAMALGVASIGIIVSGCKQFAAWLQGADLEAPHAIALWAALLSILVKELLYQYTVRKGRQLDSQALKSNAWHHRSDALSSIGAAIGIGGALLLGNRWTVLDPIASIVVGAMLIKTAVDLLRGSMDDLTECSLPAETEQEIIAIVKSVPNVSDPHNLRTRRLGNRIAIEMHVRMTGSTTLAEAHQHASLIEQRLRERFGATTHITIHMEPEK
ncbi:MAG: cation transporter [Aeriscardovia sp.]|nr:cation transporter [Aeriscardovia sp.]MBR0064385.1 cation transporter [Paludibacteraceae bacterium]MBR3390750.1 cation transporter [Prevotella sp.]